MTNNRRQPKKTRARRAAPAPAVVVGPDARLQLVLNLLRADLDTLRPGALSDLRADVASLLHGGPVGHTVGLSIAQARGTDRDLLAELQRRLRAGLDALDAGQTWRPFPHDSTAPHWELEPQADGTIRRFWWASWTVVAIASAIDLLVDAWPRLRRCLHCQAWFMPEHGRQRYHDVRCSAAARYQRFKPRRDHQSEYEKRIMLGVQDDPHRARRRKQKKKGNR